MQFKSMTVAIESTHIRPVTIQMRQKSASAGTLPVDNGNRRNISLPAYVERANTITVHEMRTVRFA
jgi:hypothetical protein